jgi:hypothetical protein
MDRLLGVVSRALTPTALLRDVEQDADRKKAYDHRRSTV